MVVRVMLAVRRLRCLRPTRGLNELRTGLSSRTWNGNGRRQCADDAAKRERGMEYAAYPVLPDCTLAKLEDAQYFMVAHVPLEKRLMMSFYTRREGEDSELFHVQDQGQDWYGKLMVAQGQPVPQLSVATAQRRLMLLGSLAGKRLREEYDSRLVFLRAVSLPYRHYLKQNPAIFTAFVMGMLGTGVQVNINLVAVATASLNWRTGALFFQQIIEPLRRTPGCRLVLPERKGAFDESLRVLIPPHERIHYLHEYSRLLHMNLLAKEEASERKNRRDLDPEALQSMVFKK